MTRTGHSIHAVIKSFEETTIDRPSELKVLDPQCDSLGAGEVAMLRLGKIPK